MTSILHPPSSPTLCGYTPTEHLETADRWEALARQNKHLPCGQLFARFAKKRRLLALCGSALRQAFGCQEIRLKT